MENIVSSLQSKRGTKPNAPTKNTEHEVIIKNNATFSRHACLASLVGLIMHLLGMGKVTIQAKDDHNLPSVAALADLVCSGSGTLAVANERRDITVDCAPTDSLAHEYLAFGTNAAEPAMERARY